MIKKIALKEIYHLITSIKYFISLTTIIVLIIINSLLIHKILQKDIAYFSKIEQQNIDGLRKNSKNFWEFVFYNQILTRKGSDLMFCSSAENDKLPNGIELNYFRTSDFKDYKKKNFIRRSFTTFDWSNILIYVLSFIVIVFSYDSVSGEKQKGTLKLLSTYSLKKWELLAGKFLGISLGTASIFAIGFLINIIIINLLTDIQFTNQDVIKTVLFFLTSLLFISFFVICSIFVSSITYTPSKTLSILLIFWTVFTLIIPNISWILAKEIKPVKSYSDTQRFEDFKVKEIKNAGKYTFSWDTKWEKQMPNKEVIARSKGIKAITIAHNDIWNNYKLSLFAQTKSALNISKISPCMLYKLTGEKLSDNGFYGFINFYDKITKYFNAYQQFLTSFDTRDKNSYHIIWEEDQLAKSFMSNKPLKYDAIPKFEYENPDFFKVLNDCLWEISTLFILTIVFFIITYFALIRYDVR